MNLKDKLVDTAAYVYILPCLAVGIVAGKSLFSYMHNQDHSTLETFGIGVLSVYVGVAATGLLAFPAINRFKRKKLPECPECKRGRLHTKTKVLGSFQVPWSLRHCSSIRGTQEINKCEDTINCDRCDYQTIEYDNREGTIYG